MDTDFKPEEDKGTPSTKEDPQLAEQTSVDSDESQDTIDTKELSQSDEEQYVESLADGDKDGTKEQDTFTVVADDLKAEKRSFLDKVKAIPRFWWQHKWLRYGLPVFLLFLGACAFLVPSVRYTALNVAGVRVPLSTHVVDSQTSLPLENIPVMVQGQEKRTNEDGYVEFDGLKLGSSQLVIDKSGYAPYVNDLVLGWGSNPLKHQPLVATGTQFRFVVTDWLSGLPITDVEARSGEDIAAVDEQGVITLTVGELDDTTEAVIAADGYREYKMTLPEKPDDEYPVMLVPEKKHVFVSNRDGVYDLYKTDVDGENEEVLLEATGKEREIPHAVLHPEKEYVAYISTRDGEANSGGFIYDGLYIIDVRSGTTTKILRSEQVQIIGWSGDSIVYTAVTEGVSGGNPERSKIFSHDIFTGDTKTLASSNYFNDVQLVNERVYYSVSSFAVPKSAAKLFSILPTGEDKKTVVDAQVWTIVQAGYETLHFQAVDDSFNTVWYTKQGDEEASPLDAPPVTQNTRYYNSSPNREQALRVEERDGKGTLLNLTIASGEEQVVQATAGLTQPVYWLNDRVVVYRVVNSQESADYVVSLDGGDPKKIADVIGNQSRYFY